jgi:hypothetical protein
MPTGLSWFGYEHSLRAKAALKRQDAKSALELLDEQERRFPKSKNAEIREQFRKMAVR